MSRRQWWQFRGGNATSLTGRQPHRGEAEAQTATIGNLPSHMGGHIVPRYLPHMKLNLADTGTSTTTTDTHPRATGVHREGTSAMCWQHGQRSRQTRRDSDMDTEDDEVGRIRGRGAEGAVRSGIGGRDARGAQVPVRLTRRIFAKPEVRMAIRHATWRSVPRAAYWSLASAGCRATWAGARGVRSSTRCQRSSLHT